MPQAKKIFISHIADESADAARAKGVLEKTFGENVELFLASSWESIPPGEDWFRSIENAIHDADVMIVLASSESVLRPWILFETGAAWFSKKKVVPICYKGMTPSALPEPIRRLQAVDVNSTEQDENFSVPKLVEGIRIAADLPQPIPVSLQEAPSASGSGKNASMRAWMLRPTSHIGEEIDGVFKVGQVDTCDPSRAREAEVDPNDSLFVRLYLEPGTTGVTYINTIASGQTASFFERDDILGKAVAAKLKLKAIHQSFQGSETRPVPVIQILSSRLSGSS